MVDNIIRDSSGVITGIIGAGGQFISLDTIRQQSAQQTANPIVGTTNPTGAQQPTPQAPQQNPTLTPVTFLHDASGNVVTKPVEQNPVLTPMVFSHDEKGNVVASPATAPKANVGGAPASPNPAITDAGAGIAKPFTSANLPQPQQQVEPAPSIFSNPVVKAAESVPVFGNLIRVADITTAGAGALSNAIAAGPKATDMMGKEQSDRLQSVFQAYGAGTDITVSTITGLGGLSPATAITPFKDLNARTGLGERNQELAAPLIAREGAMAAQKTYMQSYDFEAASKSLASEKSNLELAAAPLTKSGESLKKEYSAIETARSGLDVTNPQAVSEFNAKVSEYNVKSSLLGSESSELQKRVDLYNQNVATYGTRVSELKGLEANVKNTEQLAFSAGALEVQNGKFVESPLVERPYGAFSDWSKGASDVILGNLGVTRAQVLQGENLYKNDLVGSFGYGAFKEVTLSPGNVVASAISGAQFAAVGAGIGAGLETLGAGSSIIAPAARTTLAIGESVPAKVAAVTGIGALTYAGASKGFTASPSETAVNLGASGVDLAAMVGGGALFAATPRAFSSVGENIRNINFPTAKEVPAISSEFGSIKQSGELTLEQFKKLSLSEKETYNLYGTTTPISDIIAKQAFERRLESSIRVQSNTGGDILTRAYESSRKEPAVAPWEREIPVGDFDLKTLRMGGTSGIVTQEIKSEPVRVSPSLMAARELISRVPEPSNAIPEPALPSWERAEILKRLYPEEYTATPSVERYSTVTRIDLRTASSATRFDTRSFEESMQLQEEITQPKSQLPYKEPIDVSKLNNLLPSRGELNIPTEGELKQASLSDLIKAGYDWNVARKMAKVGESTSGTPEVLLQLQSRVSPAPKARAYAEVPSYTSVPSALELSAISEREYAASLLSTRPGSSTKLIFETSDITDLSQKQKISTETTPKTYLETSTLDMLQVKPAPDIKTEDLKLPMPLVEPRPTPEPVFEPVKTPTPTKTPPFVGGGAGITIPLIPWLPGPSGGGGAGGVKNPFRRIQHELLYIGPRSYPIKRVSKKKRK